MTNTVYYVIFMLLYEKERRTATRGREAYASGIRIPFGSIFTYKKSGSTKGTACIVT